MDADADAMRSALEQAAFERAQKEAAEQQRARDETAKRRAKEQERQRKIENKALLAEKKENAKYVWRFVYLNASQPQSNAQALQV